MKTELLVMKKFKDLQAMKDRLANVVDVLLERHYKDKTLCISFEELEKVPNEYLPICMDHESKNLFVKGFKTSEEADKFVELHEKDDEESDDIQEKVIEALEELSNTLQKLVNKK